MTKATQLPEKDPHLRLLPFVAKEAPQEESPPMEVVYGVAGMYSLDGNILEGPSVVPSKVCAVLPLQQMWDDNATSSKIVGYSYDVYLGGCSEPIKMTFKDQASAVNSRIRLMQRVSAEFYRAPPNPNGAQGPKHN